MGETLRGRTRELEALRAGLTAAAAGSARAFALVGEPGIGKTRLSVETAELAASLGFTVRWAPSWEAGGAPAYWPWRSLLALEEHAPALALLRGEARIASSDPAQARFELFEAVCHALREAAARSPLLCVFDDLHAADLPSLELAAFATRSLRSSRIAWLMTWRETEAGRAPIRETILRLARAATVYRLAPLSPSDTGELASEILGATMPGFRQALFEATAGNPLFVVETARALASRGGASNAAFDRLPLAESVSAVALERAGLLSAPAREALEVASIIGREVELRPWAHAASSPPHQLRAWAAEATRAGLLLDSRPDRWTFTHALVRDAICSRLDAGRSRALHLRIAGFPELDVERRAHHTLAAHPLADAQTVVTACVAAAEHARAQSACEEAIPLLERARAVAPEAGELLVAQGWAHSDLGQSAEAKRLFGVAIEAARRAGDARMLARAVLGYGSGYLLGDVRTDLVALIDEAAAALGDSDSGLLARLRARKAAALTPAQRPLEVLAMAREAIAGAREADAHTRLEVAVAAGSALGDFAPAAERQTLSSQLVLLARELGDRPLELRGLSRLFTDHLEATEVARADALLPERDALARSLRLPRLTWNTPLFHSMRAMVEGRFAECRALAGDAHAMAVATGELNPLRTVAVHRFWLALLEDDREALAPRCAEAVELLRSMPAQVPAAIRAVTAARLNDPAAARAALSAFDVELSGCATNTLATLGEVFAELGERELCAAVYQRLLPHLGSTSVWGLFGLTCGPPVAAAAGLLAARLEQRERAAEHFEVALRLARGMKAVAHETWVKRWAQQALGTAAAREAPKPDQAPIAWALKRQARGWAVERAGTTFLLPELRGLQMLNRLVETPGLEVHALELVGADAVESGDAGEHLDEQARREYRRRLSELQEDVEDARGRGDVERAERAQDELQALARELSRAVGAGGRVRKAGSAAERARVSAQQRLREAIKRIAESDPALGEHLQVAVRTGVFCAYEPHRRRRDNS